jgi:DNA polymerase I-like protein with 3'-5' exonuclease and polymerase domains
MEWNGLPYDSEASLQFAVEQEKGIARVDADLTEIVEAPINWGSPKQFSTVLYGGELTTVERIQVPYKHADMFSPERRKTKVERTQHTFPRLVEPLRMHGKESLSVEEGVLKRLEPKGRAAKIIGLMQVRAKIAHLVGTYLRGLPRKIEAMGWLDRLHPSLNQCVAVTGRLSSSNPNGQNLDPKAKRFFRSRYD